MVHACIPETGEEETEESWSETSLRQKCKTPYLTNNLKVKSLGAWFTC
jgi:hypothetical protein